MAILTEVVLVMHVFGDKVGYRLAGIEVYSMHKAYRVDVLVDTEGRKVVGLGAEIHFRKDSLSTVGSKVN